MRFSSVLPVAISLAASSVLVAGQTADQECAMGSTGSFCNDPKGYDQYIIHCDGKGSSYTGNCNDNLDEPDSGAYCYESSPTAGDAQCVTDCTTFMAMNGTSYYPKGCSTKNLPPGASAGASNTTSTSTGTSNSTSTGTHPTGSAPLPTFTSGAVKDLTVPNGLLPLLFAAAGTLFA